MPSRRIDLYQTLRQPGGINRYIRNLRQQVWQRPGVILVAVRDDNAANPIAALKEIGHIRDDDVDPKHVVFRKHQTSVYDQDILAILHEGHILADLTHPTHGDNAQLFFAHFSPLRLE